jgi:peptidoglycan/LPS O-acetylase OafA/YrhL
VAVRSKLSFNHRPEIDGLRALAVLPVIFFHAGFESFSGGFVGVDVFFVISGYLITSLILVQKEAGSFRLVEFYERRARRILPALFFVVCATIPFAWLWLRPSDLAAFGDSVTAVFLFASNVLFWSDSGYFDTASEMKPLLHTWSLSVEEQYYLIFPLFVIVMWKLSRQWLGAALFALTLCSLALAQWGSMQAPSAAFYLLPTRAWEILLGALIAFYSLYRADSLAKSTPLTQTLGIAGLLLIGYSVYGFDAGTRFPGFYALVPTVGTGLIIMFATSNTVAGKLLRWRPLVAIGLVSYSSYLWHHPLFAFAKHRASRELPTGWLLALAAVSLLLAFVSWRWVEQPFRDRGRIPRRKIFAGALAGNIALMAIGLGLRADQGHSSRFPAPVLTAVEPSMSDGSDTCAQYAAIADGLRVCQFGDARATVTVALYGDSHADALLGVMHSALLRQRVRGVHIVNDVCHAIPGIVDSRYERDQLSTCPATHERMLQWLRTNADYTVVMLRWTYRLYPVPGLIDRLLFDNGEGGIENGDEPRMNFIARGRERDIGPAAKQSAIHEFLIGMAEATQKLVVVYPVPEAGWDVPRYSMARYLASGTVPEVISTSAHAFNLRNQFITAVLDEFDHPKVDRVRPASLLCGMHQESRCVVSWRGVPLYYDEDHLSNEGAAIVVNEIVRSLRLSGQPTNGIHSLSVLP